MRVTVFGATGKIGSRVVARLLADGHEAVVFVRNPAKLGDLAGRVTAIEGQLSDPDAVGRAVAGSDAVISALGPDLSLFAKGTPVADGTRTIVAAMQRHGVRRYIGLGTPSAADPRDSPRRRIPRLTAWVARHHIWNAMTELYAMTDAVASSSLEWTVARITNPVDAPSRGTLRAGFVGRDDVGWRMSREDIAAFLVGQLTDATYLRAMPAISN